MNDKLYIPKKINVGFQTRSDTYTKQLAYIIYWDDKGVLRKEKSWQGWRDKKIEPQEFENKPHNGFVLNKSVKRDSSYFGNGRNMIRVYDDRGFEFEITTGNLLFILMTTNCHKRGLEGEFVYAWYGTELVLLPTGCEEYENSMKFTEVQGSKVSAKALIPGASYITKNMKSYIYLGRYDWYDFPYNYHYTSRDKKIDEFRKDSTGPLPTMDISFPLRKHTREHLFWNIESKKIEPLQIAKISSCTNPEPVFDFNQYIDKMKKDIRCQRIVNIEVDEENGMDLSKCRWIKDLKNSRYVSMYYAPYTVQVHDGIIQFYSADITRQATNSSQHSWCYNDTVGRFPNNSLIFAKKPEWNIKANPNPNKNEDAFDWVEKIQMVKQTTSYWHRNDPVFHPTAIMFGSSYYITYPLGDDSGIYKEPKYFDSDDQKLFVKNLRERLLKMKIPQVYLIGEFGTRFALPDNNPYKLNDL